MVIAEPCSSYQSLNRAQRNHLANFSGTQIAHEGHQASPAANRRLRRSIQKFEAQSRRLVRERETAEPSWLPAIPLRRTNSLEVLVAKPGAGSLSVGEAKLTLKEVKPLPASD
jgi:hypothetical protein